MAFALVAPRPNSHPFQERQLSLKDPIKIGRAVAKAKSTQSNGIFDCKVLSRNHAVMWYENGKVKEEYWLSFLTERTVVSQAAGKHMIL